ncbi:penicillin-binding protein [Tepidibacillus fermentans]|uniref:serine-type D-Ala-D-Ala carboxypeptidase n=1 Tax=Tepidibacillus fermentans TaxID=1281767 RepID=A0A4R3KLF7_9BACI|nr:PASTA domain-containing penicillin-binding protein [Tepidibacillus fermentans]TCS84420.1 penicillin-binding protein 2B [Tepidibacillus fermentans]
MKKNINKRSLWIGLGVIILFLVLIGRIFYIQVVDAKMLQEKAQNLWDQSTVLEPKRGTIYDRNNEPLAYNASAYSVIAVLSKNYENHVVDPLTTAQKLAPLLNMDQSTLYSMLTKKVFQVELKNGGKKVDKDTADKIKELNLPGIFLREEAKRYYPNHSLAAYTLGFVNYKQDEKTNNEQQFGAMGIELQYDKELRGEPGELKVKRDPKGYQLPDGQELFKPAKDGNELVLTIDKTIQQYVENALDKADAMYHPKKMIAIVANPKTGEILAMSNRPDYDPNEYWEIQDYRNYATSYQFEPGSTFKIVTLAAAIQEGVFNPNETYQSGSIRVPGAVIKDHNNGRGWGRISFLEGVQRSSNVAFVHLGYERLGKEKLFSYIRDFGFDQKTGIDLPGESNGIMKDEAEARPSEVATMSFGQGVAVTPIQQVMAVSAVANGGHLMTPYIVKEIRDPKTHQIISKNEPIEKRRVISEEAARKTREVLEKVVQFDNRPGYIEGYHVAGKTGTAQIPNPNGKGYLKGKYIVSFIGFAPANDPKLLTYVVVEEPNVGNTPYFGSTIAAPIFKDIMQNSLRYLKVPMDTEVQSNVDESSYIRLDNVLNQSVSTVEKQFRVKGMNPIVIGGGKTVLAQYPKPGSQLAKGERIYLITVPKEEIRIPDLRGKSLREAMEYCTALGISFKPVGSGFVIEQSETPNTPYTGQILELKLSDQGIDNNPSEKENSQSSTAKSNRNE